LTQASVLLTQASFHRLSAHPSVFQLAAMPAAYPSICKPDLTETQKKRAKHDHVAKRMLELELELSRFHGYCELAHGSSRIIWVSVL
jgi:hypothetical protein